MTRTTFINLIGRESTDAKWKSANIYLQEAVARPTGAANHAARSTAWSSIGLRRNLLEVDVGRFLAPGLPRRGKLVADALPDISFGGSGGAEAPQDVAGGIWGCGSLPEGLFKNAAKFPAKVQLRVTSLRLGCRCPNTTQLYVRLVVICFLIPSPGSSRGRIRTATVIGKSKVLGRFRPQGGYGNIIGLCFLAVSAVGARLAGKSPTGGASGIGLALGCRELCALTRRFRIVREVRPLLGGPLGWSLESGRSPRGRCSVAFRPNLARHRCQIGPARNMV